MHACINHVLSGISAWVDQVLSSILARKAFICRSSIHVIKLISTSILSTSACLGKLDIKDFFLEGTHGDILDACSSCVRRELNLGHTFCSMPDEAVFDVEHFTTCLGFLLHHQYVDCTGEGLGVYQVVQGSGMGAKHSPAVSSLNFYWWVEKPPLRGQSFQQHSPGN